MSTDTLFAIFAILLALVVFGLLITGGVLVIRDTIRQRGRWGLGRIVSECPRCGASLPPVRVPNSFSQALWGGWTCPKCKLEIDKWGHPHEGQDWPPRDLDAGRRFEPGREDRVKKQGDDVQRGGDIGK